MGNFIAGRALATAVAVSHTVHTHTYLLLYSYSWCIFLVKSIRRLSVILTCLLLTPHSCCCCCCQLPNELELFCCLLLLLATGLFAICVSYPFSEDVRTRNMLPLISGSPPNDVRAGDLHSLCGGGVVVAVAGCVSLWSFHCFLFFFVIYVLHMYVCMYVCIKHGCEYANIGNMWPRVMQQLAQQHVFASLQVCYANYLYSYKPYVQLRYAEWPYFELKVTLFTQFARVAPFWCALFEF